MRLRERDRRDEADGNAAGSPEGSNLEGLRAAGQEFLVAGAAAIDRALSTDSKAFLASTRQQGGQ